jgi:aldose 1-epimerase
MAQDETNFRFLPLGAIIQEFRVGGINIVQNFATPEQYKAYNKPFFGETIGRVCNRIKGAKLTALNGKEYPLPVNNGANTLHGGPQGWGKREFTGPTPLERNGKQAVLFKYVSPDGEEGFPGTVEVRVYYIVSQQQEDGVEKTILETEYEVELVGDEVNETVVAVTNHRYVSRSCRPAKARI